MLLLEKQWNDSGFRYQTPTEYCTNKRQTPVDSNGVSVYWAISYLICSLTNINKKKCYTTELNPRHNWDTHSNPLDHQAIEKK